ncbi:signal transduction histidine kinase [Nocardia transvalensis]|uniref:histidine kinase n=1 Tax=Nocardia transvalensis TaxID=37333 RepID=A0A7W9PMH0_9NOCA|nr:ATP-binding protein [Nocardia transvalensis]MBB5918881.1 signal transduction histidine kinase [Nocardia transvalensis]
MRFRRSRKLPPGNNKLTPAGRLFRPRTIRGQLTRVLVVSVVLSLVLLGVIVAREVRSYRDTDATVRAVSLALTVQDLAHELQRERGLTNGLLGGDATLRRTVDDQRTATDQARLALGAALTAEAPGAGRVRTALERLDALADTRTGADARRVGRDAAFQFYTAAIGALDQARPGIDHARDEQVWRGLQSLYALGDVKEFTAQERGFLNGVFTAGGFGPGEYVRYLGIRAAQQAAVTAFQQGADATQQAALDRVLRSEPALRASDSAAVALAADRGPLERPVAAADWWTNTTAVIDAERAEQRTIGRGIEARADQLRAEAAITLGVYTGAAVLALLALVVLVVASARAIVRPLAALAADADDVASRRLPELVDAWHATSDAEPEPPRPVRTPRSASTEIVSVAEAFDRVQATAYELASEQALLRRNTTESLANLGRRNQNLVRRQLGLISEFEREELDPKTLANMFELDHLATRMRRNAESLLVLVGEASPRRWAEPIPLTDVIRAALSEVDDYRRVTLRRVDDVPIAGAVVSELAHMLAELIENGLAFSPPDLEVEIYGRHLGHQYLLAVVDHGVGMTADQLADANARLRGEAEFLVAPTRFLGHYVVGRLARRLDIEVELTVSPVSGVVARLLLPSALLSDPIVARPEVKHEVPQPLPEPRESGELPAVLPAPDRTGSLPVADRISPNGRPAPRRPRPPGRHSLTPSEDAPHATPHPDPFPTLPPGPMKDSLYAAQRHRLTPRDPANSTPDQRGAAPDQRGAARDQEGAAPDQGGVVPDQRAGTQDQRGGTPDQRGVADRRGGTPDQLAGSHPNNGSPDRRNPVANPRNSGPGPSDGAQGPGPASDPGAEAVARTQRTRNGLVKRARKTRDAGGRPAATARHPEAPAADRSPDQVRSMLAGFRAGHQRGESDEPQRIPVPTTQEEPR